MTTAVKDAGTDMGVYLSEAPMEDFWLLSDVGLVESASPVTGLGKALLWFITLGCKPVKQVLGAYIVDPLVKAQ